MLFPSVASLRLVSPRGGNWQYHLFFPLKMTTFFVFLVIALCSDDLFTCCLITTPTFRRRLSSTFSFSHKKLISFGYHQALDGVTRGGPPSDDTGSRTSLLKLHLTWTVQIRVKNPVLHTGLAYTWNLWEHMLKKCTFLELLNFEPHIT